MRQLQTAKTQPAQDTRTAAAPRWRLERQVTLGVVLAMAAQLGAALVWFGATGERIAQLERRADDQAPVLERLARLEEAAGRNQAALTRIEARLDQRADRGDMQ